MNQAIANNDQPAIDSFTLKVSDKHTTVDQLNQDILQLVSTDTASFDFMDYMDWIDQIDSYESDLWRVREYVARGDMTNAHAVFDNIATKHTLDSLRQIDVSNAGVILDMLDSMHYTSLYPQQLDTLVAIEAAAPGVASSWANGILGLYNMNAPLEYVLCPSIPLQPATATGERGLENELLQVYPLPALSEVTFKLSDTVQDAGQMELFVFQSNGSLILKRSMNHPTFTWNTTDLPKGLYLYALFHKDTGSTVTGKIILQ